MSGNAMLGGVVRIPVQPGKEKEFENVFMAMRANVLAREPGCNMYDLYKARSGDGDATVTYFVMEQWADQAALDTHRNEPHMKTGLPKLAALILGAPDIQFFDLIS